MEQLKVDKHELRMMLNEYWKVDNNEICFEATVLFLSRIGLNELEIKNMFHDYAHWGDNDKFHTFDVTLSTQEEYMDNLKKWIVGNKNNGQ